MTTSRVLVAGIGNVFFADDGFGCEVADRLSARRMPDGVVVEDYGIRGMHLAYELLDGYDALVLIDAVPMGEPAGTVALIEPDRATTEGDADLGDAPAIDAHTMNPEVVLRTLTHLGGSVERVVVVGCQPERIAPFIGLSDAVDAAVDVAVRAVVEWVEEWVEERPRTAQEVRTC